MHKLEPPEQLGSSSQSLGRRADPGEYKFRGPGHTQGSRWIR